VIELKEKLSIAAPPDEVWPLISDPAVVAACIPGAELNELTADGAHRGKVTFSLDQPWQCFAARHGSPMILRETLRDRGAGHRSKRRVACPCPVRGGGARCRHPRM
jgi:hypothetical protein